MQVGKLTLKNYKSENIYRFFYRLWCIVFDFWWSWGGGSIFNLNLQKTNSSSHRIIFLGSVVIVAANMSEMRESTVFDRCLAMKVSKFDFVLSHFLTQLPNVSLQIFIVFTISLLTLGISKEENLPLIFTIFCLTGFCGMILGALITVMAKKVKTVSVLVHSLYSILIILSPFITPIETMSPLIQPIAKSLPLTQPFETFRFVMHHPAVKITHPKVIYGFISLIVWITSSLTFLILWIFLD